MGQCERCGESMDVGDLNVESFELTGEFLCSGCADEAFEADAGLEPVE